MIGHVNFQRLLFDTALCVMSCDGEIHPHELEEIRLIAKNSPYFRDVDVEGLLKVEIPTLEQDGRRFIRRYLDHLGTIDLSPVHELLVLEVLLRVTSADEKLDANEIRFLKSARKRLKVPDEIISQRFGAVESLGISDEARSVTASALGSIMNISDVSELPYVEQ